MAADSLPLAAVIPYDPVVEEADVAGRPVVSVTPGSQARVAVEGLCRWLLEGCGGRQSGRR